MEPVNLIVMQRKPYTIAVAMQGSKYVGLGITKWNPNDRGQDDWDWNKWDGIEIAVRRCGIDVHENALRKRLGQDQPQKDSLQDYTARIGGLWDALGFRVPFRVPPVDPPGPAGLQRSSSGLILYDDFGQEAAWFERKAFHRSIRGLGL